MQLARMRFTRIDGTAVSVTVNSAVEAKAALKELRHKKRELKFLRGALLRQQRAARAQQDKSKKRTSWVWRLLAGIWWAIASLIELATVPRAERKARDPGEIDKAIGRIDETLHNIDGCILQLEGKLLTLG
jgi:hypothetical protein